jgi:hypothetical protein
MAATAGARMLRLILCLLLLGGGLSLITTAPARADVTSVFSDGFEDGNSWSPYTNGLDQSQELVTSPVRSGSYALQLSVGTDTDASDIGLAEIKDFSFTEDQSQLSFWYYAAGTAQFSNLTVEVYTDTGTEYYELLPGAVVIGAWTQAKVMFAQISASLTSASIESFVIKAVAVPGTGTASFTIDDVSIDDGVIAPANLVTTGPAAGATSVGRNRVLTAFYDAALDPSTVSTDTVELEDSSDDVVASTVKYEVGQRAIAIIPDAELDSGTTYHVVIDGVQAANGGGTEGDQAWSFTTGTSSGGTEDVLTDNLDSSIGWSLYSSAPTQSLQIVTDPVRSEPGALQASGADDSASFVVSAIRQTNWLDESSTLNFAYQVSGTAPLQDLVVAVTTAAGFTKFATYPIPADAGTTWQEFSEPLGSIDPELVGQNIRQVELKMETSGSGTAAFTIDDFDVTEDMDSYLSTVDSAMDTSTPTALDSGTVVAIRALAGQIEASQQPDGSIDVGPSDEGFGSGTYSDPYPDQKVDPYAANYAAMGLLRAYQVTGDSGDLTAADDWLDWYQEHLAADGVDDDCSGGYPGCVDDGNQDSVDSYASTYLIASLKSYDVHPADGQAGYLTDTYPYVETSAAALDSVYQQDGTTIAKDSYPARFAMDNAETYNGLVADSAWATSDGDAAQAELARYLAARTLYALRNRFYSNSIGHFANSLNANGTADESFSQWYPDGLSTVLALAHIGQPTAADQAIFDNAVTTFDTDDPSGAPAGLTNTPQYMWWAQAALRVGEPDEATHFVDEYSNEEGSDNPDTFAITAAHLIRVLADNYDDSLWF